MGGERTRNSTTIPAVIVFSAAVETGETKAAWFSAANGDKARTAAKRLGYEAITIESDQDHIVATSLSEGQLQVGGRLVLLAVSPETAANLHALTAGRLLSGQAVAPIIEQLPPVDAVHQQMTSPWEALQVGSHILSPYFGRKNELEGWWEAEIVDIKGDKFFLTWSDEPELGIFQRLRHHIGLLPPKLL